MDVGDAEVAGELGAYVRGSRVALYGTSENNKSRIARCEAHLVDENGVVDVNHCVKH